MTVNETQNFQYIFPCFESTDTKFSFVFARIQIEFFIRNFWNVVKVLPPLCYIEQTNSWFEWCIVIENIIYRAKKLIGDFYTWHFSLSWRKGFEVYNTIGVMPSSFAIIQIHTFQNLNCFTLCNIYSSLVVFVAISTKWNISQSISRIKRELLFYWGVHNLIEI